jgi:hypothetical protein
MRGKKKNFTGRGEMGETPQEEEEQGTVVLDGI